jgi:hypothetical protein
MDNIYIHTLVTVKIPPYVATKTVRNDIKKALRRSLYDP